jgi:hypothetical protein
MSYAIEIVGGRIRTTEAIFIYKFIHPNGRKRYDIYFALTDNSSLFTWNDEVENEMEYIIDAFKKAGSVISFIDNKYVLFGPIVETMSPFYIEICCWDTNQQTINLPNEDYKSNYTNKTPRDVLLSQLGFYPIR